MSFQDTKNFKDFLELYSENSERVVFFVGAGLSMPLFPSWATFLTRLVDVTDAKGKLHFDKSELLEKLNQGVSFLEIAELCAEALGENEYREVIEESFDRRFNYNDVPNAYKALLGLQFKSIITTNYDRIPEIGGQGNFNCYTNMNVSEALKAIEKGKKIVLKIHGDILNQDSIILTAQDFKTIIHTNQGVQNALRSLFSTSTICFLGFGLSDPHLNLILEFLNSINNGQNIIHYALLSSKSKFELHSIERRYGIRIIEYSPSNNQHLEVEEFVELLKGTRAPQNPPQSIDTEEELFSLVENKLQSILALQNYYIRYNPKDKVITINYFTRARTEYEQQKEILSIYKLFSFDTTLIENIKICCFVQTNSNIEFVKFSPLVLVAMVKYLKAKAYANSEIAEIDLWGAIQFNQPFMIGNIHFTDRKVNFAYMNF